MKSNKTLQAKYRKQCNGIKSILKLNRINVLSVMVSVDLNSSPQIGFFLKIQCPFSSSKVQELMRDYAYHIECVPDCKAYVEDPCICDDLGEPKGQCICGDKWFNHNLSALPPEDRKSAKKIQSERMRRLTSKEFLLN